MRIGPSCTGAGGRARRLLRDGVERALAEDESGARREALVCALDLHRGEHYPEWILRETSIGILWEALLRRNGLDKPF
jgi:hypothetical protein